MRKETSLKYFILSFYQNRTLHLTGRWKKGTQFFTRHISVSGMGKIVFWKKIYIFKIENIILFCVLKMLLKTYEKCFVLKYFKNTFQKYFGQFQNTFQQYFPKYYSTAHMSPHLHFFLSERLCYKSSQASVCTEQTQLFIDMTLHI